MKLLVFYNPNGIGEPEGWYRIGEMPIKSEEEGREKAKEMIDGKSLFKIVDE